MTVYAVFAEGVYRHECRGVFSSEAAARGMADESARTDYDDYHRYVVVPLEVDVYYKDFDEPESVYATKKP